jgi:hypothetical protein
MLAFLLCISSCVFAQSGVQEQLYYHSPKGLSFIPPLSRPGLVYNGKLYIGKKKLSVLFRDLHDEQLNIYFQKYKSNKTSADILSFVGGFALPIANIFISTNQGKVNWWLIGSSALLNATSGVLKIQAEKNLLLAAVYYDKKKGYADNFVPQQQRIGFTIPLGR